MIRDPCKTRTYPEGPSILRNPDPEPYLPFLLLALDRAGLWVC